MTVDAARGVTRPHLRLLGYRTSVWCVFARTPGTCLSRRPTQTLRISFVKFFVCIEVGFGLLRAIPPGQLKIEKMKCGSRTIRSHRGFGTGWGFRTYGGLDRGVRKKNEFRAIYCIIAQVSASLDSVR